MGLMLLMLSSCTNKKQMDALFYNAEIYTIDEAFSTAEAMVVNKGKIIALGDEADLRKHYDFVRETDLQGAFVYPGFVDAHCHFYGYGMLANTRVDLSGTHSFEEVIERLLAFREAHQPKWIEGRGWDQNDWQEARFPEKEALDTLFPDIPVLLTRIDGHAMLVNSRAMELAGIHSQSRIDGGEVVLKEGEPTGMLIDNAMKLVDGVVPPPDQEMIRQALLRAQEDCFAWGLTTVADAGLEKIQLDVIREMQKKEALKMRIYAMLTPTQETLEAYAIEPLQENDRLIVRSLKLYADGALGSRGAYLLAPYADAPETSGLILDGPDRIREIATLAKEIGFQVNIHCIGDAAVRMVLDTYAEFLEEGNDLRWRIEHAQIVHPEDVSRFGLLGIVPSIQATHATSDMYWAEERLGPERIKTAYAYQNLLNACGWIPNGTDFPIEGISPVHTFFSSVFRKDYQFWPRDGFQTENALSREDALRSMTIWAAKACFMESFTGSLEAGKQADFVITDIDLMTADEKDIPSTRILQTWSGGERVF